MVAQWTWHTRKQNLLNFAKSQKKSIGDLDTQLNFLWQELNSDYKKLVEKLKNAKTVREASDYILLDFERPADQSEKVKIKRAEYAESYCKKFANQTSTQPSTQEIIKKVISDKIITDETYWKNVLEGKQQVNPEFLSVVFERYNNAINKKKSKEEILVNTAVGLEILDSPEYWLNILRHKEIGSPEYIKRLFEKYNCKLD